MVKAGRLGRKTNRGFYPYKNGKVIKEKVGEMAGGKEIIAHRLILRMVNEAASCLREGIVADSDLLDAGMIFATGFAPFRGGPMNYAKQFGHDKLNELFPNCRPSMESDLKPMCAFKISALVYCSLAYLFLTSFPLLI